MVDNSQTTEDERETEGTAPAAPAAAPRRPSGHRGTDVRDTVAEMTARAQEISMEAGSKIASAMKDVINAAAGLTGFAIESARDLVQYMIRRGQMTQDEADRLMREVEAAHVRFGGGPRPAPAPVEPVAAAPLVATPKPAPKPPAPKAAAPAPKPAAKAPAKPAAKAAPKVAAKKAPPAKPAAKAAPKPAAKKAAPAGRAKAAAKPVKSAASKSAAKGKKKR
jgi:polyhydroxyalkanoate synthesis regulator phasin